ncbi:uncharacterized protein K02A2.6-like [Anneissia japonica]|uniref:uncharacterized protein K02A2.6-like n=1 Tax=Anneissia japonica TaxID=1529436 RepID=UPI001425BB25|nr:uncharacterized protein K02A2.6-like [Anneissia japonica]
MRTKKRLRQLYWWPRMDIQVENIIKHCKVCIEHNKTVRVSKASMTPIEYPSGPWEKLGLDIVGPCDLLPNQCRFAITLIDYYSKWPEVCFVPKVTTQVVMDFLSGVFVREGYPLELITDHGVQFVSYEMKQFLKQRDIRHLHSAIYHPQSNGAVERFNKVLKQTIQTAFLEGKEVKQYVQSFLFAYRNTPHSTTEVEPALLLHGRKLRNKLDIKGLTPPADVVVDKSKLKELVKVNQKKQKTYFGNRNSVKKPIIQEGMNVKVKKIGYVHKGSSSFMGPFRVVKKVGIAAFLLSNRKTYNVERLAIVCPDCREWVNPLGNAVPLMIDDFGNAQPENVNTDRFVPRDVDQVPYRTRSGRVVRNPSRYIKECNLLQGGDCGNGNECKD